VIDSDCEDTEEQREDSMAMDKEVPSSKADDGNVGEAGRKGKAIPKNSIEYDDEEAPEPELPRNDEIDARSTLKENIYPNNEDGSGNPPEVNETPKPKSKDKEREKSGVSSLVSRYSIAPRTKSTPMSELIRRVNSMPGSPFPVASRRSSIVSMGPGSPAATAYSPYTKSSRSTLSRIAPLHPNRRTPPPPLPPPPPKPKTKKEKEREEKWEEECIEEAGGWDMWCLLEEAEKKDRKRAKFEREMGGWED